MTVRFSCPSFPTARRRHRLIAAVLVLLAAATAAVPVNAQTDQEIVNQRKADRDELQEAAQAAAASVDAATATADDLIAALNAVQADVDAQHTALIEAERAEAEARDVVARAEAEIEELTELLEATQERLREAVIDSYVSFQAPSATFGVLGADPWMNAREEALAGFATGSRIDDIDELRRLGDELERWRLLADEAAEEAERHRLEAADLLAALEEARDREAELVVEAELRVERRLYEVQTIKEIDAEYAAEIEAAERRIAEALARKRAEEEAARRRAEEARRRAEEEARRQAQAEAEDNTTTTDGSELKLVSVQGFTVNVEIAEGLEGLLDAMDAEGFDLGGWGYRTHQAQIGLRKAHCGTSDYAIWQMPSSQCRPPTARPGRSNHERGLAIDFTNSGRLITSRSSAVFQALQRLAPQFGLQNLPSEPWHWSINGR